jgi:hypothetical protein
MAPKTMKILLVMKDFHGILDVYAAASHPFCPGANSTGGSYCRYVNLNIDLGITPAKSMKLMAK